MLLYPDIQSKITAAAQKYGVDPQLALGVGRQESSFNPNIADSSAGAIGPMQLMPGTASVLGVDPRNVDQNIDGGVRYLKQQLDTFGHPQLALAAYNAGPGRVRNFLRNGGTLPAETQNYVQRISGSPLQVGQPPITNAFQTGAPVQDAQPQAQQMDPTQDPSILQRIMSGQGDPGGTMQRAGAWLQSIANPSGGAAMLNATNMPLFRQRFSVSRDAYGNTLVIDNHTGIIRNGSGQIVGGGPQGGAAAAPGGAGAAPAQAGAAAPQGGGALENNPIAMSPIAQTKRAELDQETSSKNYEAMSEAAVAAQQMKAKVQEARHIMLSDPHINFGEGGELLNDIKSGVRTFSGGLVNPDGVTNADRLSKIFGQLNGDYLKSQGGVTRVAGPEIKFGQMATPGFDKQREANLQILSDYERQADLANNAFSTATKYRNAPGGTLGPNFKSDLVKMYGDNPSSQYKTDAELTGTTAPSAFKVLKVH